VPASESTTSVSSTSRPIEGWTSASALRPSPGATALELLAAIPGDAAVTTVTADGSSTTLDRDLCYVGVRDWTPTASQSGTPRHPRTR